MDEYGYVINVDAAVVRDGEYCCIERSADEDHAAGALSFPGGKLEAPPGTTDAIERTAAREVREEVGLTVGEVRYVCSATFEADDGTPCCNVVTLCAYENGEGRAARVPRTGERGAKRPVSGEGESEASALGTTSEERQRPANGEARVREPAEVAAVHWLSPDAIRKHPDAPSYFREYVDRVEAVRSDR